MVSFWESDKELVLLFARVLCDDRRVKEADRRFSKANEAKENSANAPNGPLAEQNLGEQNVQFGSFPLESWQANIPNAQSQTINLDHREVQLIFAERRLQNR